MNHSRPGLNRSRRWPAVAVTAAGVCAAIALAGCGGSAANHGATNHGAGLTAARQGRIPAGVHAVSVTPVFGLNRDPRLDPLDRAFTVTSPARLARIIALADALPPFPPGAFACPADFGGEMRLVFLARPGGPALATLTADFAGCQGVSVRVGGRDLPALAGPGYSGSFPDQVLAIAGVRWPHQPGSPPGPQSLPDRAAAGPLPGRRLVDEGESRAEQELGVRVRGPVRLGEAVGEPYRAGALAGPVELAECVAGPAGEPDHDVHDFILPRSTAPAQWQ
jgi:hypothetical protein